MKKLSICIDMGAKNNGIFIVKTENKKIVDREASYIVIENINFSKLSRRLNRHRIRNKDRFKLARRLLGEMVDLNKYKQDSEKRQFHQEQIIGLLHNRGLDRVEGKFEKLDDITVEFLKNEILDINNISNISSFDNFINEAISPEELKQELVKYREFITTKYKQLNLFINKDAILNDLNSILNKTTKKFKTTKESKLYIKDVLYRSKIKYSYEKDTEIKEYFVSTLNEGDIIEQLNKIELNPETIKFINNEIKTIVSLNFDKQFTENIEKLKYDLKLTSDKATNPSIIGMIETSIKGLETGVKPRKMYQKEMRKDIKEFDFIEEKDEDELFNIIANISNLQLRVLRKYFNNKKTSDTKIDEKKLSIVIHRYFISKHYKSPNEKQRKDDLFKKINKYINLVKLSKEKMPKKVKNYNKYDLKKDKYEILNFFKNCNPEFTIPPFEDMNNRDTYKCNSLLINPKKITIGLKNYIKDILKLKEFNDLCDFELNDNKNYAKALQRILDINSKNIDKKIYPRNIFKHQKDDTNIKYYQNISKEYFEEFSNFAKEFYSKEEKAINGIFDDKDINYIFTKCNKNTQAKRNIKHQLINTIFATNFEKKEDMDSLLEEIKNYKIQTKLEKISNILKKYQNEFFKNLVYVYILKNTENKQDEYANINDNLKDILEDVDDLLIIFKKIFKTLKQNSYLIDSFTLKYEVTIKAKDRGNKLKRFVNSLKQLYDILYLDAGGHNKTCSKCTIENNTRSDEEKPLAKRLLSDVAKPINGKLDMFLNKVAGEIVKQIDKKFYKDVEVIEILLEQNKFKFEKSLHDLTIRKNKPKEQELDYNICPYTGDEFDYKNGEYDHIISQSSSKNTNKQIYNSEANLILCSAIGNKNKGDKQYTFDDLKENHLKIIFGITDKKTIIENIQDIWDKKNSGLKYYTSFKNLKFEEQRALRYALFFDVKDDYFIKAEALLKQEQRTMTNGTQKRLAKLIFEKLPQKYKKNVTVKVIDAKEVSTTRQELSEYYLKYDKKTGEVLKDIISKQEIQNNFSHIIDAMVVYYIANKLKIEDFGTQILKDFKTDGDYKQSAKTKQWYETENTKYDIASKKLFDEKDIGVGYLQLKKVITIDKKEKEKVTFLKGVVEDSFVPTLFSFNIKDFDYFKKHHILEEKKINRNKKIIIVYVINKENYYNFLFENKEGVLENIVHFNRLTKELRYTYTKFDPFEILEKFLAPKNKADKEAVNKIIKKEIRSKNDITYKNLMSWFSRSSKLEKGSAKLGYYKSWEIFTEILISNKNELFKECERTTKENKNYKVIEIDKEKALKYCQDKLFKTTHLRRRDKKRNEYRLYSASKNDTQYIHRRKINDKYIYQVRIANGHNKLLGFEKKPVSKDGSIFFKDSKNIVPLTMDNYRLAFEKKEN